MLICGQNVGNHAGPFGYLYTKDPLMRPYLLAIIICVLFGGVIVGTLGIYRSSRSKHTINVTGSAYANYSADQVSWTGTFERSGMTMNEAYGALKADQQTVQRFLFEHGIKANEVSFTSILNERAYENMGEERKGSVFVIYKLRMGVRVESKNMEAVENVAREVTQLTDVSVQFYSDPPQYFYTKLPALKLDLLAKASKDAYDRANAIAKNSNSSVKRLKKATMGVFQITGQNSNEAYTATGLLNTTSKNKTASIIVRVEYELP